MVEPIDTNNVFNFGTLSGILDVTLAFSHRALKGVL